MTTARTWTLLVQIWLRDRGVDKATHLISVVINYCQNNRFSQVAVHLKSAFSQPVSVSVLGEPVLHPLFFLYMVTRKIIMMNLFVIIHLAPSTVGGRVNWSKQKDQLKFCGAIPELFSSLKIRCLANDIKGGGHMALRYVGWAREEMKTGKKYHEVNSIATMRFSRLYL